MDLRSTCSLVSPSLPHFFNAFPIMTIPSMIGTQLLKQFIKVLVYLGERFSQITGCNLFDVPLKLPCLLFYLRGGLEGRLFVSSEYSLFMAV
jgi:hypothetical protein